MTTSGFGLVVLGAVLGVTLVFTGLGGIWRLVRWQMRRERDRATRQAAAADATARDAELAVHAQLDDIERTQR
ncbi:hypothetical protein [Streptomyces synnematoformans]|uniref:Uncharacterized protein n=1 Tax=Streptomyces synnematoformans TaxID=415721 RepID=A0ABP5J0A3_9ACTN